MRVAPAIVFAVTGLSGLALGGCAARPEGGGSTDEGVVAVADLQAGAVRAFDVATGADLGVLLHADDLPPDLLREPLQPAGLVQWGDALLLTSFSGGEVLRLDLAGGGPPTVIFADQPDGPRLEEPCDLALAGDRLVVLGNDTRNLLLLDLDPGGPVREIAGEAGPPIRDGHGLAVTPDGRLVVGTSPSEPDLGLLQLWDPASGARVDDLSPYGPLLDATDVAVAPDGRLTVADWFADEVSLVDPETGRVAARLLGPEQVRRPVALAWTPGGTLLVLEREGLVRWTAEQGAVRLADDLQFGRGLALLSGF